jgi:hypothetical protein
MKRPVKIIVVGGNAAGPAASIKLNDIIQMLKFCF